MVCTITPASTQAEETHNTLKFASRAKKISVTAKRNEVMDQSSLIQRYQQELSTLRAQLDIVMRERENDEIVVWYSCMRVMIPCHDYLIQGSFIKQGVACRCTTR